jgi:hypothetical protein
MGIRDKPISTGFCFAERLIGSIHRECLDHIVVIGEARPRRIRPGLSFRYTQALNEQLVLSRSSVFAFSHSLGHEP